VKVVLVKVVPEKVVFVVVVLVKMSTDLVSIVASSGPEIVRVRIVRMKVLSVGHLLAVKVQAVRM